MFPCSFLHCSTVCSSSVSVSFEVEVEGENASAEEASETCFISIIPFFIEDSEREVFVGRASRELDDAVIWILGRFEEILGRLALIDELRVEDVELVALDILGRRIIGVVMHLVVLVPIESLFDTVEVARFLGLIPARPLVGLRIQLLLFVEDHFIFVHWLSLLLFEELQRLFIGVLRCLRRG